MAVKHVKEYYNQIREQYLEVLDNLKDLSEEANNNLISPERLDEIKKNNEPLIQNYMTLSYIMFLLKQPVNKKKQKRYESQSKKFTNSLDSNFDKDHVLNANKQVLDNLKKLIK